MNLTTLSQRRDRDAVPLDDHDPPLVLQQLTRMMSGHLVLDRIDLAIHAGEVVAISGANGSGKTTLLRCIANQLRPNSGHVFWFGKEPCRTRLGNRLIGYLGHETGLYPELTALENVLFAARMYDLPYPRELAMQRIAALGLPPLRQPVGQLSQGIRQRVAIARAFVHDPLIVVLDEPFTSLDPAGREWLEECITSLRLRGRAICFTSHDQDQCRRVADRVLEIRDGRLVPGILPSALASQYPLAG
jgi:heme ABC exporter ATP-binding subunit CcmA